jgi:ATP-binding cassette subfamily B protein
VAKCRRLPGDIIFSSDPVFSDPVGRRDPKKPQSYWKSRAMEPDMHMNVADLAGLRHRPLAFLFRFIRRHKVGHAVILSSVLLAVLCSVSTQYGMKHLVDVVSGRTVWGGVWGAFALLCGLIAADNFLWRVAGWVVAHVYVRVTGEVRQDLFAYLSAHSPSYLAERLPGSLSSRITATGNAVFTVESTGTWNVIPPVVAVSFAIVLIATVNWLMALVLVGLAGAMAVIIFFIARAGGPLNRGYAEAAAGVDGELVDVIGNFSVVRAFGGLRREQARFAATVGRELGARRASLLYLEKLRLLHAAMTALLTAGLVAWGIMMWQAGQASPGDLVLITALGFTILHGTRDLAVALVDLIQQLARLEEAISVLLVPHELPDAPDATTLHAARGEVRFEHVTFAYPGRGAVLKDFSLLIPPGQSVGLVGASGAGKSTVLALLQRFYDAAEGRVTIDGQDIARVTQESLRAALAIVPQDVSMFQRSVLDNLRYARPDASDAEVMRAAEHARCRDFIEALPDGFATMVGERGTKLSGGQRQRLAIARAMLKDAPILLLDEATSALDSESERAVQAALEELMEGRTVIAIAHRLATLQRFDRIIVMDHGRIVDDGSPAELARRPGPYRDLLSKQALSAVDVPA